MSEKAETETSGNPWGDPHFEQSVRDTAYFMWENDGRPAGREQDYWYRALEACLRRRNLDQGLARPGTLSEFAGDDG